jgi:hypothetical protein
MGDTDVANLAGTDEAGTSVGMARDNPGEANKSIRDKYYEYSQLLGAALHADGDPENATFPTFASWSAQSLRADVAAGVSPVPGAPPDRLPPRRLGRWLYDKVAHLTLNDNLAIARNIATGQALIYEEVGPTLESLLAAVDRPLEEANPKWDEVWKTYTTRLDGASRKLCQAREARPQDENLVEGVNVALLRRAVEPYFMVIRDPALRNGFTDEDRKRRAELILLANMRLGAYEQKRLQPVLERNLKYLPEAVRLRIGTRLLGRETWMTRTAMELYARVQPGEELLDEAFQIAATRHVYSMILGNEILRFGVDLPLPPPAHPLLRDTQPQRDKVRYAEGDFFPYHLQVIERHDLWAEWEQFDRSAGQGVRTGVDNWLRLPERLNYIVNLFRSRQQLVDLYDSPSSTPVPVRPSPPVLGPVVELPDVTRNRLTEFYIPSGEEPGEDG